MSLNLAPFGSGRRLLISRILGTLAEVRPDRTRFTHADFLRSRRSKPPLLPELARQVDFPERAFGRRDRVSICPLRTSHKGLKRLRPAALFQLTLLRCFDTG